MTPETRALLATHDHPSACEAPPGFDRAAELARVRALVPTLQRLAGVELRLDDSVQDASYFCDLAGHREERPGMTYAAVRVCFSAFGRLVTITSADDSLAAPTLAALVAALADAGFTYVDADQLDEPYTGTNPHLRGQRWWIRFFDYL